MITNSRTSLYISNKLINNDDYHYYQHPVIPIRALTISIEFSIIVPICYSQLGKLDNNVNV